MDPRPLAVFDLDGTLADVRHRLHHIEGRRRDWDAFFSAALLRIIGGLLRVEGVLVRGDEARVSFRADAVPRMKGLSAAFHDVQFQAEVRRSVPLVLKLTRLGGAPMIEGLVRALRSLVA